MEYISHNKRNFAMKYGTAQSHIRALGSGDLAHGDVVGFVRDTPHKEVLDHLMKHPSHHIRREVAERAFHKDHLDHLMKDEHPSVRGEVAASTTHKEHFAHLMNDKDEDVRHMVAQYTPHKEHALHMMHDKSEDVVAAIARRHPETHDHLVNHPDEHVRHQVAMYSSGVHLPKLAHDPDHHVRVVVASRAGHLGHENLYHHLMTDSHPAVRATVAAQTKDKDIATHLSHDENQSVVTQAKKALHIKHGDKSMLESFSQFTKTV